MNQATVKDLRSQVGMTIPAFARLVDVSPTVAKSWHLANEGHRRPPTDLRDRVVDGLRRLACQVEDLDPNT